MTNAANDAVPGALTLTLALESLDVACEAHLVLCDILPGATHARCLVRMLEQSFDRLAQSKNVSRRDVDACVLIADYIGLPTSLRAHDRLAHRHRLQDRRHAGLKIHIEIRGIRHAAKLKEARAARKRSHAAASGGRPKLQRASSRDAVERLGSNPWSIRTMRLR